MELYIFVVIALVTVALISKFMSGTKRSRPGYSYAAKDHIMTETEENFFRLLNEAVSEKYFVFPQIHLSAILDHTSSDQNSLHAFRHINQKSVDYVLCDKNTLKPVYAIELDDYTHRINKHRYDRDVEVDRIFQEAGMPLVRFKNLNNLSKDTVVDKLADAYQMHEANQSQ